MNAGSASRNVESDGRTRRTFVIGNWKMQFDAPMLDMLVAIDAMAAGMRGTEVAICPPATIVTECSQRAVALLIGAQDCHHEEKGAYTGRLSAALLARAGAHFVLLGHSECRAEGYDTDERVRRKAELALACGMRVVICVGESRADRDAGRTEAVIAAQVSASLPSYHPNAIDIAYEPIWAIGTGQVPVAREIAEVHRRIRSEARLHFADANSTDIRILYGGSVNADNAEALLSIPEVDGLLVGQASLELVSFKRILAATARRLGERTKRVTREGDALLS